MHKGRVYYHPAPDTNSPSKLFNFSGTCLLQHSILYFLTIASEIVKFVRLNQAVRVQVSWDVGLVKGALPPWAVR